MSVHRRLPKAEWYRLRHKVWERDGHTCVRCVEVGRPDPEVSLKECHCDHIKPLSMGGSNDMDNLRTLCRYHHVLRKSPSHRGLIAWGLKMGIIPANWRPLVWE